MSIFICVTLKNIWLNSDKLIAFMKRRFNPMDWFSVCVLLYLIVQTHQSVNAVLQICHNPKIIMSIHLVIMFIYKRPLNTNTINAGNKYIPVI